MMVDTHKVPANYDYTKIDTYNPNYAPSSTKKLWPVLKNKCFSPLLAYQYTLLYEFKKS